MQQIKEVLARYSGRAGVAEDGRLTRTYLKELLCKLKPGHFDDESMDKFFDAAAAGCGGESLNIDAFLGWVFDSKQL